MKSDLKLSALLQDRMNDAVSAACWISSNTITAEKAGLTFAQVKEVIEQIRDRLMLYYWVDVALPKNECWVLSAEKRVVALHPELETQFVSEAKQNGYIPVALDLDNEAHRQVWMEALPIVMKPYRVFPLIEEEGPIALIPKPHRSQREGE